MPGLFLFSEQMKSLGSEFVALAVDHGSLHFVCLLISSVVAAGQHPVFGSNRKTLGSAGGPICVSPSVNESELLWTVFLLGGSL